jgi:hypothetical protein
MTDVLPRYMPLLLLAVAWEAVSRLGIVSPAALPPLDKVATPWLDLAASGDLWSNGVASITPAAAGLGLAIICGSDRRIDGLVPAGSGRDQSDRAILLPDAEIGTDPGHGAVARLWRRLEDRGDLCRLHAADHLERL